jgi:sugar transferase (PEP-CTERM/EpsH1 system associated)
VNGKPLIAHVLYRLDTGGMEQIAISVINGTRERYRHVVICLAGVGTMRDRIEDATVACLSLDKQPGKDWGCYFRLWKALRRLKPNLVQTYNIGALDAAFVARLAGVPRVVHAEHGRDVTDPHGRSRKYRRLRRGMQPFITRFVAVCNDLQDWLRDNVGIPQSKIVCIANGIDTARYTPAVDSRTMRPLLGAFAPPGTVLIGNVGRLDAVKDQAGLITAFRKLCDSNPEMSARLRLAIVGEGDQRQNLEQLTTRLDLDSRVRLLGNRDDVAALLAECDVFALSSLAEGMPLTVLEAMAAGLPVVATDVGSVRDVVVSGTTGTLVASADPAAMAAALAKYVRDGGLRQQHGRAGSVRVQAQFSLPAMVSAYVALYDGLLAVRRQRRPSCPSIGLGGYRGH